MKKISFLLLLFTLQFSTFHSVQAKPVTLQQAQRVAERVLPGHTFDAVNLDGIYLFSSADGKGFVLVSGDDCVRPLLAYSTDGIFEVNGMPAHVAAWLDGYRREIASLRAAGIEASPEVQALWQEATPRKSTRAVAPLLTTRWAQRAYYNKYCPYDTVDSAYSVTGCVATAMAQLMRYWQYPETGWNQHSYYHRAYGLLSANFGATHYRWNQMPDTLNALCDSMEVDAVATLMYHAGVAVEMQYSPTGSGALDLSYGMLDLPCAENAMKTYFRYNPMLRGLFKNSYSDSEWDSLLRVELDAARPVFYCGSDMNEGGHAFLLDGYDTLGMFHVNWGWGGYYDAFYTIDSLSPGAGSLGGEPFYTFNFSNSALVDVYPAATPTDTVVTINFVSNNPVWGSVEGCGTYRLYDTVTIVPRASEGCRYMRFASSVRNVPISFLASCDISDTVLFEHIEGDTVGYCHNNISQRWRDDYGNTTEWAIRIPSSLRQARQLAAVQFYGYEEGDYTISVYLADTLDGATPVYTTHYSLTGAAGWRTIVLDSVLTAHYSQVLWIAVSMTDTNITFPLVCSSYSGNPDGNWYHFPWGWRPMEETGGYYTWNLKAVFLPQRMLNVAASPNDIALGDVYGMGSYYPGDTIVLTAVPKTGCVFDGWSNGLSDNPLVFVVTRDTALVAYFHLLNAISEVDESQLKVAVSGLSVTIDNPTGGEIALYDISGRLLATHHSSFITHHFSTSGVYLLKLNGLPVRKIVAVR